MSELEISLVAPMHNEEGNAKPLYLATKETLEKLTDSYEIIFVNDTSSDNTLSILKEINSQDPKFHYCDMAYNVGENWALLAGVSKARGKIIVTIDGDFQNDPKFIPQLLSELNKGYRVVSGWRKERKGGWLDRVLPSVTANALIALISGVRVHDCGCGLKAYRRDVLEGRFVPKGFMNRFSPVVFGVKGSEFTEVEIEDRNRSYGKSHYGLERIFIVMNDLLVIPFVRRRWDVWSGGGYILGIAILLFLISLFWIFANLWQAFSWRFSLLFLVNIAVLVAVFSIRWNLNRFKKALVPQFSIKEFK